MSFSSISNSEKLLAAQIALKNVEVNLYRLVGEIGLDPDSFDMNAFSYDESNVDPNDIDSLRKVNIKQEINKILLLNQKIEQLS